MPIYSERNKLEISFSVVFSLNLLETVTNIKDKLHPKQNPNRFSFHPWTVLERKVTIVLQGEDDHKIISEMLVSNKHQLPCLQHYPRAQYRRKTFI